MPSKRIEIIERELIEFCKKHQITIAPRTWHEDLKVMVCDASGNIDDFDYGNTLFESEIICPNGLKADGFSWRQKENV